MKARGGFSPQVALLLALLALASGATHLGWQPRVTMPVRNAQAFLPVFTAPKWESQTECNCWLAHRIPPFDSSDFTTIATLLEAMAQSSYV